MAATLIRTHRSLGERTLDWVRVRFAPGPRALHQLDHRTLVDIGVDASEIASIEAESRGSAELTRLRIVNQA